MKAPKRITALPTVTTIKNVDWFALVQDGVTSKVSFSDLDEALGDEWITGGTYNPTDGCATFTSNSAHTFVVCGFLTGYTDAYTYTATTSGNSIVFDSTLFGTNYYNVDLTPILSANTFTGGSEDCITDLYVTNIHGCSSGITIHDNLQYISSDATGANSFAWGSGTTVRSSNSVIIGGNDHIIDEDSPNAGIFAGSGNTIFTGTSRSVIIGGESNIIAPLFPFSVSNTAIVGGSKLSAHTAGDNSVLIGGEGNSLVAGAMSPVARSVILGGSGIIGEVDDTVYVPKLNIGTVGSDPSEFNLGIDSDGFVVTGSTSSGSTFSWSDPVVKSGNTSGDCISQLWVSAISGCSDLLIGTSGDIHLQTNYTASTWSGKTTVYINPLGQVGIGTIYPFAWTSPTMTGRGIEIHNDDSNNKIPFALTELGVQRWYIETDFLDTYNPVHIKGSSDVNLMTWFTSQTTPRLGVGTTDPQGTFHLSRNGGVADQSKYPDETNIVINNTSVGWTGVTSDTPNKSSLRFDHTGTERVGGLIASVRTSDWDATGVTSLNSGSTTLEIWNASGGTLQKRIEIEPAWNTNIYGDITVKQGGLFYTDLNYSVGPIMRISGGSSDIVIVGATIPGGEGIGMGSRGATAAYPGYGKNSDGFIYSSAAQNGLNIISQKGTATDDYIRFYAGKDADPGPADMFISGTTSSSFIGMGTETPTEKLHVVGSIRMVDGTQQVGYVLTSDADGVGSWQPASGGTSSGFSWSDPVVKAGNTSGDCIDVLWVSTISGCSPVTIGSSIQSPGSTASGLHSIAYGDGNVIDSDYTMALGGSDNSIGTGSTSSGIFAGSGNTINDDITQSVIIGGENNEIFKHDWFIAMGYSVSNNIILGGTKLSGTSVFKNCALIGGENNEIFGTMAMTPAVSNTVVLGGSDITGGRSDTVYVPSLNIGTPDSGIMDYNLGIDSSGFVVTGSTGSTFSWSDPVVKSGNTTGSCIDQLFVSTISGCSPVTIGSSINLEGALGTPGIIYAQPSGGMISGNISTSYGGHGFTDTGAPRVVNKNGDESMALCIDHPYLGAIDYKNSGGKDEIFKFGVTTSAGTTGLTTSFGTGESIGMILNSDSSKIASGVTRSVIIGGSLITGTTSDTVYVPNLNIGTVGSGTSINSIGIDSEGNVVSEPSMYLTHQKILTKSDILAITGDTGPIEIMAAPGPGKFIDINTLTILGNVVGTGYTHNCSMSSKLFFQLGGLSTGFTYFQMAPDSILDSQDRFLMNKAPYVMGIGSPANLPLNLFGNCKIEDPTGTAEGTMVITVEYKNSPI